MAEVGIRDGHYSYESLLRNMNYDLKHNIYSHVPLPSLKYITFVKIASSLWQKGFQNDLVQFLYTVDTHFCLVTELLLSWDSFAGKILEKVAYLNLPICCIKTLKRMICTIGEEISNFLDSGEKDFLDTPDKLQIYCDNFCWTQQGTIDSLKTAVQIIDHSDLSVRDKYIIACNNCLEEKIRNLMERLSEDSIKDLVEKKVFCLIKFWTFHVRGEHERFSEITNGGAINADLLSLVISNKNEVAVQYIWENFADAALKKRYLNFIIENCGRNNILLYLFKVMREIQLEEVSLKMSYCLLRTLHRISNWCNDFSLAEKYVLELIKRKDVFDAFKIITLCWQGNIFDLQQYMNIWNAFAGHFRLDIETQFKKMCVDFLFYPLMTNKNDTVTTKLLLKMGTFQDKKDLLYSGRTMSLCCQLIWGQELDLLDMFINEMLMNREEILKFKKIFFDNNGYFICCFLLKEEDQYDFVDEVLIGFCDGEEISNFKYELPYKDNAFIIGRYSADSTLEKTKLLMVVDKFLNWCFEGNEEDVTKCKAVIYDLESDLYSGLMEQFFERVKELMKERDWESVEKYWKWILFATEDTVGPWKEKLARIKKILHFKSEEACCGLLIKRFVTSCFEREEAEEFKEGLKNSDELNEIVRELLQLDKGLEIDALLDWCYSSDKVKIDKFKVRFM